MGHLRRTVSALVRKPLNVLGLDIVRRQPTPTPASARQFGPSEANKFLWISSLHIKSVIDVGAHTGEFATMVRGILPTASILSFEPVEDSFRQLESNMRNALNFKAFNCALGEDNTKINIHRSEFAPSSSLLPMAHLHKESFPFTARETVEVVEVRRLDDVAQELHLEDNILIKIDVQGYEDKVIAGGEELISRAKMLILETSFQTLYEGQPLFEDIYDFLKQRGFRYEGNLEQLQSPVDGRVLQADAIFIK